MREYSDPFGTMIKLRATIPTLCSVLLMIFIPLYVSCSKKSSETMGEKKTNTNDTSPNRTVSVFYSMQASIEYFAEITGELDRIFQQAKQEGRRVAVFVDEQGVFDSTYYNTLIAHKKGYKKYLLNHAEEGFYTAQFLYLWKKVQKGYAVEIVQALRSNNDESLPEGIELNTQTSQIVQVCRQYSQAHPKDYLICIRSITDRGNLSFLLRHNTDFAVQTFYTHAAYKDFAIPDLYKAEHKQLHDITVLPATALADTSAVQLLKDVEQTIKRVGNSIDRSYLWVTLFFILLIGCMILMVRYVRVGELTFKSDQRCLIRRQYAWIIPVICILFWGNKHNLQDLLISEAYTPREVWLKNQVSELLYAHNLGNVYRLYQEASHTRSSHQNFYQAVAKNHFSEFRRNIQKYKKQFTPLITGVLKRGKGHTERKKILIKLMGSVDEYVYSTLRLIQRESTFKTNALSYKGARGLMQVMPETRRIVLHRLKRRGITPRTWPKAFENTISENLVCGSEYFSWLNSIFYISKIIRKSDVPLGNLSYGELIDLLIHSKIPSSLIDSLVDVIELSPLEKRYVQRMALGGFNAGEQNRYLKKGQLPKNDETKLYIKYIDEAYRLWMKDEEAGKKAFVVLIRSEEETAFKQVLNNARNALFTYLQHHGSDNDTLLFELLEQDSSSLFQIDYLLFKHDTHEKNSLPKADIRVNPDFVDTEIGNDLNSNERVNL